MKNIIIIGSSGAIGLEFLKQYALNPDIKKIYSFSRKNINFSSEKVSHFAIDIENEDSIIECSSKIKDSIDAIIIATGFLHDKNIKPEKRLSDVSQLTLQKNLAVNFIGPALILRYFSPFLRKDIKTIIAILSARVGSISDNKIGGWYSYRASKAALNQLIKTSSIENKFKLPKSITVGFQPGTVDSNLSKPFQKNIKKLFTPQESVESIIAIINNLDLGKNGKILDWKGEEISP